VATPPTAIDGARLTSVDRRDALLDAAAALIGAGDLDDVTMEAVAARAGVSRPLVYKHFANRRELLEALYRRESALLHNELASAVAAADTVEGKFQALIHGALAAQAARGATFLALRAAGSQAPQRQTRRSRDRATLRHFASEAVDQLDLDEADARAAVAILLGAIDAVLAQWRTRPTAEHAAHLERTYLAIVVGGLERLHRQRRADQAHT
jgi:AcrR family transcriptional regulator